MNIHLLLAFLLTGTAALSDAATPVQSVSSDPGAPSKTAGLVTPRPPGPDPKPVEAPAPNNLQAPPRIHSHLLATAKLENAYIQIIVDRGGQRAYLLVDGKIAINTPISTGRAGKSTPLGDFEILEKRRTGKISTIYHVPLERWMRLTWRGVGYARSRTGSRCWGG